MTLFTVDESVSSYTVLLKSSVIKSIVESSKLVICKKPTHPTLEFIKLSSIDNQLKVTTTDMSTWTDISVDSETIGEFQDTLLNFRSLELLARSLKVSKKNNPVVAFVFINNECNAIVEGGMSYKIERLAVEKFPDLPDVKFTQNFTTNSATLNTIHSKIGFCAAKDETRQVLTGIHITNKNTVIEAAATDGHRLGKVIIDNNEFNVGSNLEFTIRATVFQIANKLLSGIVTIGGEDEDYIVLADSTTKITTRLLRGQYPIYNQLIPVYDSPSRTQIIFNKDDILNTLNAAGKETKIIFNIKDSVAELEVSNIYRNTDTVFTNSITCNSNVEFEIAFTARYLKEAIQSITDTTVNISCLTSNNLAPVLIVEGQSTQLLMPLQLKK